MVNRRQSLRRLLVNPSVVVSLGKQENDVLFDLSEGGLSVFGYLPKNNSRDLEVEFNLPGHFDSVKAQGEIAWSSKLRNLTGIRFNEVDRESRLRLRSWMGGQEAVTAPYVQGSNAPHFLTRGVSSVRDMRLFDDASKWLLAGGLSLVLLSSALLMIQRHHRVTASAPSREAALVVAPQTSAIPYKSEDSSLETISRSLSTPGFILQVGAMAQEANADALSASLKNLGFPVLVFKHTNDRFYRIAVGPYSDLSSADRVKKELRAQKFASIVKPWAAE